MNEIKSLLERHIENPFDSLPEAERVGPAGGRRWPLVPGQRRGAGMTPRERSATLDAEYLSGHRFPDQEDMSLVENVDLLATIPGRDTNWLESWGPPQH